MQYVLGTCREIGYFRRTLGSGYWWSPSYSKYLATYRAVFHIIEIYCIHPRQVRAVISYLGPVVVNPSHVPLPDHQLDVRRNPSRGHLNLGLHHALRINRLLLPKCSYWEPVTCQESLNQYLLILLLVSAALLVLNSSTAINSVNRSSWELVKLTILS